MKRFTILSFLVCLACCQSAVAQPSWTASALKSIVTLHAIQQSGDTLTSAAFFIDGAGTLLAPFKVIQRARQAWAADSKGTVYEISRISGFNATYNIVKLQAATGKKKVTPLRLSPVQPVVESPVFLMPDGEEATVTHVDKAGSYDYYTLNLTADPSLAGNPLMNSQGEVVAILQAPLASTRSPYYALDVNFCTSLTISAMDANHTELQSCSILKQLPSDETQAKSFMYLCQGDTETQLAYAADFIAAYPQSPSGYVQKAECLAYAGDYAAAQATYDQALQSKVTDAHELLASRSTVIYQLLLQGKQLPSSWTLESALDDIRRAYEMSPLPLYTLHEARLLYAMKNYEAAAERFTQLTQTNMRTPDLFIYVAQCRESLGATPEELLALNDSAIACFSKPYPTEAADYLWIRAGTLTQLERYREAIADLGDYEHLMSGRLTDNFYYDREQLEVKVRMFAQAINDIQKAIQLNSREPLYHAEQAVLLYRLGNLDEAAQSCRTAIQLDDTFADAHRLLGICLRDQGDTASARTELQRALSLGDELAQGLLDQMQ
ncbi:MAG: tetratricopeptide repeat protein [Prevotellaceae bacterium]|nr:tetratricopeptide repeat protein [Prevotellaceae bacterium]